MELTVATGSAKDTARWHVSRHSPMNDGSTREASHSTVSATVSRMQPGSGSTASLIFRGDAFNAEVREFNAAKEASSSAGVQGVRQPSGSVEMLPYADESGSRSA